MAAAAGGVRAEEKVSELSTTTLLVPVPFPWLRALPVIFGGGLLGGVAVFTGAADALADVVRKEGARGTNCLPPSLYVGLQRARR